MPKQRDALLEALKTARVPYDLCLACGECEARDCDERIQAEKEAADVIDKALRESPDDPASIESKLRSVTELLRALAGDTTALAKRGQAMLKAVEKEVPHA